MENLLLHHRSKSNRKPANPPKEFVCPISGSLMSDPVVVSSGQTFERVSVQVCRDLGFAPPLDDDSIPDFTTVIPNLAIKSTILSWCDTSSYERPGPPDYSTVEKVVRTKMAESRSLNPEIRVSESELLNAVAENPPVLFSHAATEFGHRVNHFYSSSSEESVIVNNENASPFTPLPLATRPACYASSSNSSSEITEAETLTLMQNTNSADSSSNSSLLEEKEILAKLKSPEDPVNRRSTLPVHSSVCFRRREQDGNWGFGRVTTIDARSEMMRGRDEDDEEADWEDVLESGGLSRSRYQNCPHLLSLVSLGMLSAHTNFG
ncbi:hypothetical protein GH714_040832 [Hevea brasiliensis]|uniref:RING-type E3 ubiquitin transferase n=1 Tax=Hevea brasiliensis TaxID=3981 RepID=A0A6A6MSN7_HEVBR|nr:hypothetical protein GH714_040832 [Hevea brasiliensis]